MEAKSFELSSNVDDLEPHRLAQALKQACTGSAVNCVTGISLQMIVRSPHILLETNAALVTSAALC